MEQAIRLAIEKGGYDINSLGLYKSGDTFETWLRLDADNDKDGIVLDPLFWQALGRALGWSERAWFHESCEWFRLKLTGGSEEKFWDSLLNK